MSKRTILRDPQVERRHQYNKLEISGEAQAALWEALELLHTRGLDIGPKARKVLKKRSDVKKRTPK